MFFCLTYGNLRSGERAWKVLSFFSMVNNAINDFAFASKNRHNVRENDLERNDGEVGGDGLDCKG